MAKKQAEIKQLENCEKRVRVLVAGPFGNPDDVVLIGADQLLAALASGQVDDVPEAVQYAESLSK